MSSNADQFAQARADQFSQARAAGAQGETGAGVGTGRVAVAGAGGRSVRSANGQLTAVILGFFGSAWFGWAHQGSPAWWNMPLIVGSVACLLVALLGAVRLWPVRQNLSARDRNLSRRYGIVVGASYGIILIGNIILARTGNSDYISPWVSFAIGVHFWALLPVLKDRILIPLGAVVVVIAGASVLPAWPADLMPSAIAGVGTGLALLVVAVIEVLRRQPA